MKNFCRQEVKNNQASLKCWGEFLSVIGQVQARNGNAAPIHTVPGSVEVSAVDINVYGTVMQYARPDESQSMISNQQSVFAPPTAKPSELTPENLNKK
jgi:hypothetical protein